MSTIKQKAIRGAFWASAELWGRQVFALAISLYLVVLLNPDIIGEFAIAMAVYSLMEVFIDRGIADAIVQRLVLEPEHLDAAFWLNTGIAALLATLAISAAAFAPMPADLPNLRSLVVMAGLLVFLTGLASLHKAILIRRVEFRILAMRSVLAVLCGGVVGLAMAYSGYGIWSLVGQQVTDRSINLAVLWWGSHWRPRLHWSTQHARTLLPYSIDMIASSFLLAASGSVDRLLVGLLLGPAAAGIYVLALRILDTMAMLFLEGTQVIALTTFSRLQCDRDRLQKAFYSAMEFTSLVSFPVFIGIAIIAPTLIPLVFGAKWAASGDVLQIFAISGIPFTINVFTWAIMRAMGRARMYLQILGLLVTLYVVLLMALIQYGVQGAAVAKVLSIALVAPLNVVLVKRLIEIEIGTFARYCLPALAATATMAVAVLGVEEVILPHLPVLPVIAVAILTGALVYGTTLLLIGRSVIGRAIAVIQTLRASAEPASAEGDPTEHRHGNGSL